jgi:hypothetical protein
MIELTDELLVAFADGELSAETSAAVQAQISRDPEAQGKVKLEFLVRPHGVFIGGYLSAPLAVVKVMK